jgi:hypothetical protein
MLPVLLVLLVQTGDTLAVRLGHLGNVVFLYNDEPIATVMLSEEAVTEWYGVVDLYGKPTKVSIVEPSYGTEDAAPWSATSMPPLLGKSSVVSSPPALLGKSLGVAKPSGALRFPWPSDAAGAASPLGAASPWGAAASPRGAETSSRGELWSLTTGSSASSALSHTYRSIGGREEEGTVAGDKVLNLDECVPVLLEMMRVKSAKSFEVVRLLVFYSPNSQE